MSEPALRFERATVRYAGAASAAIEDVSFDVAAGELVVLLGPSGCGKSTLLRTVNGMVPLGGGRVLLDGRDVSREDPVALRRGIGYAIQAVGLFSHMTVARNIAVVPSLLRWPKAEIRHRIDELLDLVQLDPARYCDRYPHQLSGGEAQRVGVARAIAGRPRVLLMDEPFGAVDAIVRADLQRALARIVAALGTTTLFVTHDVEEAMRLADRIVVLRAGRVEQTGTPPELLEHPATPYIRDLLHAGDEVYERYFLHARDALRGAP